MKNNYVATIRVLTMPFGRKESKENLNNLANCYFMAVQNLFMEAGLAREYELKGYWKRGCLDLIIDIFRKKDCPVEEIDRMLEEEIKKTIVNNTSFEVSLLKKIREVNQSSPLKPQIHILDFEYDPNFKGSRKSFTVIKSYNDEPKDEDE